MGDDHPQPPRTGRITGSSVLTPPTGIPVVPDDAKARVDPLSAVACLCGHGTHAHEHWRPGSDCSACGAAGCSTFRRRGGRARGLLRRLRLVG